MKRQKIVLVVLLVILFASLLNNIMRGSDVRRIAELTYRTGMPSTPGVEETAETPRIRRELLNPERGEFRMGRRGIFEPLRFAKKKPPKPKPEPKPEPAPPPPPPVKEPTPMEKAVAAFTFIGFMEAEKIKTIFLARGDEIYIVKEGDTILGQYLVKRIRDDKITITSSDGSEVLEISLVEHEPLRKK